MTDGMFTLSSSKGDCAFKDNVLTCGHHISTPVEFSVSSTLRLPILGQKLTTNVQTEDGKLAYNGNTTFFADKAPKGKVQSDIFISEGHALEISIGWR